MAEALGHGVVPTVALAAHTGLAPVRAQALPGAGRPSLTPTGRMHAASRPWLPVIERQRSRLLPHLGPPTVAPPPPHPGLRAALQPHGAIQPACAGRKRGHSSHGDALGYVPVNSRVRCLGATVWAWPAARGPWPLRRVLQRSPAWLSRRPRRRLTCHPS